MDNIYGKIWTTTPPPPTMGSAFRPNVCLSVIIVIVIIIHHHYDHDHYDHSHHTFPLVIISFLAHDCSPTEFFSSGLPLRRLIIIIIFIIICIIIIIIIINRPRGETLSDTQGNSDYTLLTRTGVNFY